MNPLKHSHVVFFNSRSKPMGLIIALDDAGKAIGELFWDDGVTRGKPTNVRIMEVIIV